MGGSFDPIHLGHLAVAESARTHFGLDTVVFVPAGQPWQKQPKATAPHRYQMARLAVAEYEHFQVSRIEVDRPGPTYTVDTLRELHRAAPDDQFWFIAGADSMVTIASWREADAVLDLATFVAVTRPGHDLEDLADTPYQGRITPLVVPSPAISSTQVRTRLAAGKSVADLIPAPVEDYIRRHGLYGVELQEAAGQ